MAATSLLSCPTGPRNLSLPQALGCRSGNNSHNLLHISCRRQGSNIWGPRHKFDHEVGDFSSALGSKQLSFMVESALGAPKKQHFRSRETTPCVIPLKDTEVKRGGVIVPHEHEKVDGFNGDGLSEGVGGAPLQAVALGFIAGGFLLVSNSEAVAAEGLPIHHLAGLLDDGIDGVAEWIQETLFYLGQEANGVVKSQLAAGNTLASVGVIFGAGLVTSFSPCTLSVLPLTIGYIGGYDSSKSRASVTFDSLAFALGLATTLAGLGVVASLAGKAYGQIGQGLPIAVSCVAILMGLNLLQVVQLQLPSFFSSFNPKESAAGLPSGVQAYLAGLTFALAASPCSTPVLATLLSFVASTQDPIAGGGLLLAYTTGYVSPLLVAATFTGALKRLLSFRRYSNWINPTSGALLLGGGVYSLLTRVFPETSMMNMVM